MSEMVLLKTGLLPHSNPGLMGDKRPAPAARDKCQRGNNARERESRLLRPGEAHWRAPDKVPSLRLRTIEECGPIVDGLHDGHLDRYR